MIPDTDFDALQDLKASPHWILWTWGKQKTDGSSAAKIPCSPNGSWASFHKNHATYAEQRQRATAAVVGPGYAPQPDDPFILIDIDGCRNPLTGELTVAAQEIVQRCGTYVEASPSGKGLRIIGWCDGWTGPNKCKYKWENGSLEGEIYFGTGWVTITEQVIENRLLAPLGELANCILEKSIIQPHDDGGDHRTNPDKFAPIDVIRETLAAIPNEGIDWDYWKVKIGMPVYAACNGDEDGYDAWREWSEKCPGFQAEECEKAWNEMVSSEPGRYSYGSLFHRAVEASAKHGTTWPGPVWKKWKRETAGMTTLPRVEGEDSTSPPKKPASFSVGDSGGDDIGIDNDTWEAFLQRPQTKKGDAAPYGNILNAGIMFRYADVWKGVLAYDDFSDRPLLLSAPPWYGTEEYGTFEGPRPLTDNDATRATAWMQGVTSAQISQSTMFQAIMSECEKNKINVVRDYLESVVWDGVSRLDRVIIDYLGAEDTEINRAFTAKTLIAAVARIYRPGCKVKTVLVLKGPQDIGKSKFCAALVPNPSWYTDVCPDMTNKDAMQQLRGIWIQEHAEMATLSKAEAARAKAFVSSNVDRYRPSYGKLAQEFPRQCVFIATVNPESTGFLRDATGASRYWIIACGIGWDANKVIDDAALAGLRDQIWAEAVVRFKAGETWWLDTPTLRAEQIRIADDDYEEDVWAEKVAAFLMQNPQPLTTDEVLVGAMRKEIGYLTRSDQMRAGTILVRLGRKRRKVKRSDGTTKWVYVDPETPDAKGPIPSQPEGTFGANVVPIKR